MKQNIIIAVLFAVLSGAIFYGGYLSGYRSGELAAAETYAKEIKEYRTALDNQTAVVNKALDQKAVDLTKEVNSLLKDTQQIRIALKNQPSPLVVVNEGDCRASDQLLDARRKIIERANQ